MKSEAHKNGWPHPTVHVWLYTSAGEVLLQQRGKNKDTHPLLWDVSVAGHVGAGEDIKQSAIREVEEEVGLIISASDLIEIGVFPSLHRHSGSLIDHEFHHCFLTELQVPIQELKKQESEVEDLCLIPLKRFKKEIESNDCRDKYVPDQNGYYNSIIEAIGKQL